MCFEFSVMSKNGLIRAIRLISKFMTLQPVHKQLEYTYWPISREEKTIRQMRFGQIIERKMKFFFFEKSYTKYDGDTIPSPFSKKSKFWSFIQLAIMVCQVEDYQNILKLSRRPLSLTSYKDFLKNKIPGTCLPVLFSAWFLKKNIYLVTFYYLAKFYCLVSFTFEILRNMCNVTVC